MLKNNSINFSEPADPTPKSSKKYTFIFAAALTVFIACIIAILAITLPRYVLPNLSWNGHVSQQDQILGWVYIDENEIPYIPAEESDTAPYGNYAGLWCGTDDTNDGDMTFLVGHNPGAFTPLLNKQIGDIIKIEPIRYDEAEYIIRDIFAVPNTATAKDIEDRVTGYGESLILQTCINNSEEYQLYVCEKCNGIDLLEETTNN